MSRLREALLAVINERDTELDMMRCQFAHGTPENNSWHEGVYAAWQRFDIVKAAARAALAASDAPASPSNWTFCDYKEEGTEHWHCVRPRGHRGDHSPFVVDSENADRLIEQPPAAVAEGGEKK